MEEIAHVDMDAGGTKATHVLLDDRLTLRTDLKGIDMQMREQQARLYRDASCAEADVP